VEIPRTKLVEFLSEQVMSEQKMYRDTFYFQNTFCKLRVFEAVKQV